MIGDVVYLDKVNAILNNQNFIEYLNMNIEFEENRIFCKHNLQHSLDVARIAYIMVLEKNIKIDKQLVYAAALLHDIGRWKQYKEGIPHETASCNLAEKILKQCQFEKEEIKIILSAISSHRGADKEREDFNEIFYLSDKLSRPCFTCKAKSQCNWSDVKKNYHIIY